MKFFNRKSLKEFFSRKPKALEEETMSFTAEQLEQLEEVVSDTEEVQVVGDHKNSEEFFEDLADDGKINNTHDTPYIPEEPESEVSEPEIEPEPEAHKDKVDPNTSLEDLVDDGVMNNSSEEEVKKGEVKMLPDEDKSEPRDIVAVPQVETKIDTKNVLAELDALSENSNSDVKIVVNASFAEDSEKAEEVIEAVGGDNDMEVNPEELDSEEWLDAETEIYHYTTASNYEQIKREGMKVEYKIRGNAIDELFDSVAPEGLARGGSIYFSPEKPEKNMFSREEDVVLSIKVDPNEVFVVNGEYATEALVSQTRGASEETIKEWAKQYWESRVTLVEYKKMDDDQKQQFSSYPEILYGEQISPNQVNYLGVLG